MTKLINIFLLRYVYIAVASLAVLFPALSFPDECQNWQLNHPEWIFCDDFESTGPLVAQGRYFEYDNNNGDFIPVAGTGLNNSRGMRAIWQQGEAGGGSLHLAFGRNPGSGMSNGIRSSDDFREIYYRMFVRMQAGWSGVPDKLSRATVIAGSDWSQAMIAHLWTDGQTPYLFIDPASCVDSSGNVVCVGYNDFNHISWLGHQSGTTPLFDASHSDKWYCIEAHVKLNDPSQSNGIQEFWIDDQLQTSQANLNFVKSYQAYAINAIFFENYWNNGAVKGEQRYFDNIVVSTQRIGCGTSNTTRPSPPANLTAN